ncbi:MAG: aldehyde dehydrogenase (NADP(+)) [Crocinitomicaceae bacterium]
MITGKNYIGNDLVANGKNTFKTFSPVLNDFNSWNFVEATDEEVKLAADNAWIAFNAFRKTTCDQRALFLETIGDEIELLGDELIEVYILESGLPEPRAIAELTRTLFQLRSLATFLKENKSLFSVENNTKYFLRKKLIPLGPVVVFGASNFPFAYSTAGGDTASAFAAGCPVIVKSHPMHAGTSELVASVIIKAILYTGMPDGVFSNLNCADYRVGTELVKNNYVKAAGFTGSIKGGRAIFDLANQREEPIPVFAEMGSINPIVISEKSLVEKSDFWADKIGDSMLQSAGQFCTSPGVILAINSPNLDTFSQKLVDKIENSKSELMLGKSIKASFSDQKSNMIGHESTLVLTNTNANDSLFSEPTVLTTEGESFLTNKELRQEVFGSFMIIVKCKNIEELETIVENLEGQLTGTIICSLSELESYSEVIEQLQYRVGRLIFNGVPTGVEVSQKMNHGGPYPASTDSRFTAVGSDAIFRWLRPICFQNIPDDLKLK